MRVSHGSAPIREPGMYIYIKQEIQKLHICPLHTINLQRRFSLSQGSRKYKLIKDVYSVKHDGHSVSEHHTVLRGIWEELNAMNELPRMTTVAEDVTRFLNALLK